MSAYLIHSEGHHQIELNTKERALPSIDDLGIYFITWQAMLACDSYSLRMISAMNALDQYTFVLEKVAHLNSPCKDELCGILYNLCLLLWWDRNEPFCQADLALPADKKEPVYL